MGTLFKKSVPIGCAYYVSLKQEWVQNIRFMDSVWIVKQLYMDSIWIDSIEKLDELTKYVLTKEPEYQEYIQISKVLKEEAKSLYGESKRESKDAEKNALFDLKKRTGNAILTELKKQDSQIKPLIESMDQMQSIYNERSFRTLKQLPTNEYKYSYEEFMKRRKQFQQRVVTQRSLRQLNRTINAHEEKYHASKSYEEQQRRIQMEQERQ